MSQFNYFNEVNNLLQLDGELKNQMKPRWQRKKENSINMNNSTANQSKLSISYNNSYAALNSSTLNKTPNKQTDTAATKNDRKSPGKLQKFEAFISLNFSSSSSKDDQKRRIKMALPARMDQRLQQDFVVIASFPVAVQLILKLEIISSRRKSRKRILT